MSLPESLAQNRPTGWQPFQVGQREGALSPLEGLLPLTVMARKKALGSNLAQGRLHGCAHMGHVNKTPGRMYRWLVHAQSVHLQCLHLSRNERMPGQSPQERALPRQRTSFSTSSSGRQPRPSDCCKPAQSWVKNGNGTCTSAATVC